MCFSLNEEQLLPYANNKPNLCFRMSDLVHFLFKAKNTCTNYNIYLCVLFIKLSFLKIKFSFPRVSSVHQSKHFVGIG